MAENWRRLHRTVVTGAQAVGRGVVLLGLAYSCPADRHVACAVLEQGAALARRFTGPPTPAAGHPERVPAPWPGDATEWWLYEQLLGLGGSRHPEHGG